MSLLRNRLIEFQHRIANQDLLTLFSRTCNFSALQISITLQNLQILSPDLKYRAACILEILTGQRPMLDKVDLQDEFCTNPTEQHSHASTQRMRDGVAQAGRPLTVEEMRMIAGDTGGIRLKCDLAPVNLWAFVQKSREFYLPDLASVDALTKAAATASMTRTQLESCFKKPTGSKARPRAALAPEENPPKATAAFVMHSMDLVKFPDIALFFEPLSSVLSTASAGANVNAIQLMVRPTMEVKVPRGNRIASATAAESVDNLKVMNYFLSLFFNPYLQRSTK